MMTWFLAFAMAGRADTNGGDWDAPRGEATGFIHTQKIDGVWWFVEPDGRAFVSKGVNHVSYSADEAPSLGYSPYERAVAAKYGSAEAWADASVARLRNWGFNTIGAWSSPETFRRGMAYTVILNIGARAGGNWQKGRFPDVFSDAFREAAERIAEEECAPRRDDPALLGYFTDNELRWGPDWRSDQGLLADFWELPGDAAGKKAAADFLRERGIADPSAEELAALDSEFLRRVAARYFAVTAAAIRRADPNHLILGVRYAGYAPAEVVQSMADNVDVVSYNNYDFLPPEDRLLQIYEWTGKPVMLTEFSFKAMDSGLPNSRGAGRPVQTQAERAEHFEEYVTALMRLPVAVGYHWFEHADEPAEGRFDGENSNYGLVNIGDVPWETLTERMTAVNARIDALHAEGLRR